MNKSITKFIPNEPIKENKTTLVNSIISNNIISNSSESNKDIKAIPKEKIDKYDYAANFTRKEALLELKDLIMKYSKHFTPSDEEKIISLFNRVKDN